MAQCVCVGTVSTCLPLAHARIKRTRAPPARHGRRNQVRSPPRQPRHPPFGDALWWMNARPPSGHSRIPSALPPTWRAARQWPSSWNRTVASRMGPETRNQVRTIHWPAAGRARSGEGRVGGAGVLGGAAPAAPGSAAAPAAAAPARGAARGATGSCGPRRASAGGAPAKARRRPRALQAASHHGRTWDLGQRLDCQQDQEREVQPDGDPEDRAQGH